MSLRPKLIIAAKVLGGIAVVIGAPVLGIMLARGGTDATPVAMPSASASAPGHADETAGVPNDFVGVLLPPKMANLSPHADGRILSVSVKLGQAVHEGDILVAFDPRARQHDLAMAEAQLAESRAEAAGAGSDLAAARKRAARREATIDVGGQKLALVSGEEAAQAHYEANSAGARAAAAVARIAQQKANVEQLKLALEETALRAPFDGVVTGVNFEPGMTAHTGDIVARVVGGQGLRTRIAVPEEATALVPRKRVRLTLEGKELYASIDQRAMEVEPASRAFLLEGTVELKPDTCGGDCSILAGRAVRATMLRDGAE
jgi:RND family efflux transporter MFP subunit